MTDQGKAIIFSAPSGSGKTTIVKKLIEQFPSLKFSISATTRQPRGNEKDGEDYYFLSLDDFENKIRNKEFFEYEEVYSGTYYGTLKSEVQRIWDEGNHVIFDVDVVGGVNLKSQLKDRALGIFIKVGDSNQLKERLQNRGTDSQEEIEKRVAKATEEMGYEKFFDASIVNDDLDKAINEASQVVRSFLEGL